MDHNRETYSNGISYIVSCMTKAYSSDIVTKVVISTNVNVGMNSESLTKEYQYEHCVVNGDYSHNTQCVFFEMHFMIPKNISLPKVDDFNMTFFL